MVSECWVRIAQYNVASLGTKVNRAHAETVIRFEYDLVGRRIAIWSTVYARNSNRANPPKASPEFLPREQGEAKSAERSESHKRARPEKSKRPPPFPATAWMRHPPTEAAADLPPPPPPPPPPHLAKEKATDGGDGPAPRRTKAAPADAGHLMQESAMGDLWRLPWETTSWLTGDRRWGRREGRGRFYRGYRRQRQSFAGCVGAS